MMTAQRLLQTSALLLAIACTQPASTNNKKKKVEPAASSQAASTSEPTTPETQAGSAPTKEDMKLTVSATAPIKEPTPITPQKTDPECEAQDSALSDTDKDALLSAYIEIQKDYLEREKGVKNFKLTKDPKDALRYELSFVDIFGNSASMKYKFGKAITDKEGGVTLCLDEGAIMLWAGTYKRDPAKKFIPDL